MILAKNYFLQKEEDIDMRRNILIIIVLGFLIVLFTPGCEKQPTKVEKLDLPTSQEMMTKRDGGAELQIGNFEPKPEIIERMEKLMKDRGGQKGCLEFFNDVKRVKPEEYEKYKIKSMSESEIREYALAEGSTNRQEGDDWWIEGHAWVTPWFAPPGEKCVYLGFSSIASEPIDYIDYYGEVWIDYNPFVYYFNYRNNSNCVGVLDWWHYDESESYQWDVWGSHTFGDNELFLPNKYLTLQWTHDDTYL